MFYRLSLFVIRYPRYIIVAWLLLWAVALPFATRVSEVLSSEVGTPAQSEAALVEQLLDDNFASRDGYTVFLLSRADAEPSPLDSEAYAAFLAELLRHDSVLSINSAAEMITIPLQSAEGHALALVQLNAVDFQHARERAYELANLLPRGHKLTGGAALENELLAISEHDTRRAELFGLPISLLILIFAFGAVVAASLPVIVAVLSVVLSLAVLFWIGQGWTFASYAQIIVTMLGLATGIDYALVIINRFREELRNGFQSHEAAAITTRSAGRAVLSSGFTVMIALCALLIPRSQFVQSIGLGGIVVLFFSVSISITLLPAILLLLGNNVNALSLTWFGRQLRRLVPKYRQGNIEVSSSQLGRRSQIFWQHWAERILRFPWAWAVLGMALLSIISLPALNMNLSISGVKNLTEEVEAKQSYNLLKEMELDSLLKSYDVLIDFGERSFYHPSSVRSISKITRDIKQWEDVTYLLSPTHVPSIPSLLLRQYYATAELAQGSAVAPLVNLSVSAEGRYVLLQVFPSDIVHGADKLAFQQKLERLLESHELTGHIGGIYVGEYEWQESVYSAFPIAIAFVYIATFILLALLFHSFLIPLKSIIVNTMTVLAAFGVITFVVQQGYGGQIFGIASGLGFIESAVPLFIFATVFGISMDYEVFLMARVFEAHKNGSSDRDAVIYAIARTGSVITNAAAIMVIVFIIFLFSHIVLIKTLSLGLSIAVLLDATLVRLAIVPATMLLLGKLNWWLPQNFKKIVERLDLQHD